MFQKDRNGAASHLPAPDTNSGIEVVFGPQNVETRTCGIFDRDRPLWTEASGDRDAAFTGILKEGCSNCRNDYVHALWREASTWAQVSFLSYCFIRGELYTSAQHRASLDDESGELVSGSKRLHQYGTITCDSQPYMRAAQDMSKNLRRKVGDSGKFHEFVQKPYLKVSLPSLRRDIPKDKVEDFVRRLLNHASMEASVFSEFDKYPSFTETHNGPRQIKALGNEDPLYSLLQSSDDLILQIHLARSAPTLALLEETPFHTLSTTLDLKITFFPEDCSIPEMTLYLSAWARS
jgi:hypothetical protein